MSRLNPYGRRCQAETNYGHTCYDPAPFAVYWRTDGSDAADTCAQHLAKTVRNLRAATNSGAETNFKIYCHPRKAQL
jgi:hypothetical protein